MKKLFVSLIALVTFFTACTPEIIELDNTTYIVSDVNIDGVLYKKLEGNINIDLILSSSNKWLLSGGVFVEDGFTLSILDGQTIYADTNVTTFLSVQQGGKVNIQGSQNNPIIFTPLSNNPTYGTWGGIIINGFAKLNTGLTAEGEGLSLIHI